MFEQTLFSYGRFLMTAAFACVAAAGCGTQATLGADVFPTAQATANSQAAIDIGEVAEVTGSYGDGCKERQGAWSLAVKASALLTHAALSVERDNSECVLLIDGIRIGAGTSTSGLYVPKAPIPLLGGYSNQPVGFGLSASAAPAFYVNASILPDISFHSDFTIQVVYAEDPAKCGESKPSAPPVAIGGGVSIQGIATPDYIATLAKLKVNTSLLGIVTSVTGSVEIDATQQTGESYCVLPYDLGQNPAYEAVDAAFRALTPTPMPADRHCSIPWIDLKLLGASLLQTAVRTLVIAHEVNGIRAYQTLTIKVNASL